MRDALLVLSVFLACAVEAVEALTIVLAVGTTRSWRSTWLGVASGLLTLVAVVAALGPAVSTIPITLLRLTVGGLILAFGLQWLRKAILRAGGFKDLHDEAAIYAEQIHEATAALRTSRGQVEDWYAFTVAYKAVVLEGLEVVFIVVTFGANQRNVPAAVVGAGAAVVLVVAAGIVVHGPLSRMPENTVKFIVGVMLTSFGMFWGGQGAGASWPGGDIALAGLMAATGGAASILVAWLRRQHPVRPSPAIV